MHPLDPTVGLMITASFALLFGAAGVHKLRSRAEFERTLTAYDLLPEGRTRPVSVTIPVLEVGVAAGLLLPMTRDVASLAGVVLLDVYAAAMGLNLRRGRLELDCGCLGFGRGHRISGALLWRNLILGLVLLAVGWLPWGSRPFGWMDAWTVAAGLSTVALLYLTIDGLIEHWRHTLKRQGGLRT